MTGSIQANTNNSGRANSRPAQLFLTAYFVSVRVKLPDPA